MIWFVGMNDTRVMECTSLYYKLKNQFIPKDNSDPYWQFVYCARRVLGKVIIEKSRGEESLIEQDTIENVS